MSNYVKEINGTIVTNTDVKLFQGGLPATIPHEPMTDQLRTDRAPK